MKKSILYQSDHNSKSLQISLKRTLLNGKLIERILNSWLEIRENLGRSCLQIIGIVLGVASVLGGFSILDSQKRHSEREFLRTGGFNKLNISPSESGKGGTPSALQMANLGLRIKDATDGQNSHPNVVGGVSLIKNINVRIKSSFADQERIVTGASPDFINIEGYKLDQGRMFCIQDMACASPVALLGSQVAKTFFPNGNALGEFISIENTPVRVIGIFRERIFMAEDYNMFSYLNRRIYVPTTLVQQRFQGDHYQRLDRIVFKIPNLEAMQKFAEDITVIVRYNHRQQEDFEIDDVAARVKKHQGQNKVFRVILSFSGILALIGSGMVNINIQLASLRERIREIGVKMAIGASSLEMFKEFLTEALLLTVFGEIIGLFFGVLFSFAITGMLKVPLFLEPMSFIWAFLLALTTGFIFALFPAWKASRQSPMEAIRFE